MDEDVRRASFGTTALLLAAMPVIGMPSTNARPADASPIEAGLRRKTLVLGQESERFNLADRMAHYRVPGLSIAIVDQCRIIDARGFGSGALGGDAVSDKTLFQAGSVSKVVAAVGALRLVEDGKLSLDASVQGQLGGWTLPDNALLQPQPVTLRRLLSHGAGLSVSGFKGYGVGTPLPDIKQILDGQAPANTAPVRVVVAPGSEWRYSGGGYVMTQLLMTQATGKPFPQLMEQLVLAPAGMKDSSYAQPLDARRAAMAASGTLADGTPIPGKWHVYPEMAAAGLWTTPTDLARFAIRLVRASRGENGGLLREDTADEMLRRQIGDWGLGVEVSRPGAPLKFSHTGAPIGYRTLWLMHPDTCQGAVLMANADEGMPLIQEVVRAIADHYRWPDRMASNTRPAVPLSPDVARRFVGTYRLKDFPTEQFVIARKNDGTLFWARKGYIGRDLLPETPTLLFSPDSGMTLEARDGATEEAQTIKLDFGGGSNVAERVPGP